MISLLLLIMGILCIVSGYVQDLDPKCKPKTEVQIVARDVYNEIIKDSVLNP